MNGWYALFPFVLLFYLMIFRRWAAKDAMPVVWFVGLIVGVFIWGLGTDEIIFSSLKGFFVMLDLLFIVFGALWLVGVLKKNGSLIVFRKAVASVSSDIRVQVILIAWLFETILEGIAGFGTPAAIAGPLLVVLGLSPMAAIVIALMGDSTAVSFGALGTPLIIGISGDAALISSVTWYTALLHFVGGTFVPLMMMVVLVRWHLKKDWSYVTEMIPFALLAGLLFTVPFLASSLLGPELPSVIGGIVGLIGAIYCVKKGWLLPERKLELHKKTRSPAKKKVYAAIAPYGLLVVLLLLSRSIIPLKEWLRSVVIDVGVHSFEPLYNPGFYLALVTVVVLLFDKKTGFSETIWPTFGRIKGVVVPLLFTLWFVQLLSISSENSLGLASMPLSMAALLPTHALTLFFVPFIGALGAFVTGSNTVSNLLFADFQIALANSVGANQIIVLAMQVVGGAIGNMIAIHNILAASATVGLHHQESNIMRVTLVPMLVYASIVGVVGLLLIY